MLGSGLGAFADEFGSATRIPYDKIPGFPRSTIEGPCRTSGHRQSGGCCRRRHAGPRAFLRRLLSERSRLSDARLRRLGIRAAILTNAAGAINLDFNQGALVVIRDHINLQGTNPLIGPTTTRFGPRFPDMSRSLLQALPRDRARRSARNWVSTMHEGVYAALSGPSFETPAEIRYFKTIGADMVGMSTVPEVIVARHMGIRVLGISCVTNMAAGILDQPINHAEVLETGERVKAQFVALLRAVIPRIAADLQ